MTGSNNKHRYMICKFFSFYIFHLLILAYVFFSCSSHCFARDTLSHEDRIVDGGETLVSAGERFELGFFTPNGSFSGDERRYVGIWYHNLTSQTVVWVANWEKPLTNSDGFLAIKDGNLEVLDMAGNLYWSALLERSVSSNLTVKLMDSGNLVLYDNNELGDRYLWQSFEHPTDTFLPHMKMDKNLYLIAWKDENNPENGNFTFKVDEEDEKQFILTKKSSIYWRSREPGEMRVEGVTFLLSNFSTEVKPTKSIYSKINTRSSLATFYDDTRLVINFTGQIQFLKLDKRRKTWSLLWSEPRDRCGVFNACGKFGVCNIETIKPCKCLPGFEPSSPQQWDSENYLEGCTRKTKLCGEDSFLSLKMMKVGLESSLLVNNNETQCRKECLDNCQCQAYSFEEAQNSSRRGGTTVSGPSCRIWEELNSLQEYENGGRNIFVRVALSDLEPNGRTCQPCGTTMIPYPLSTAPDCGDPMYFRFLCNTSSTGWVSFRIPRGEYRVISIDPEKRRFVIDTNIVENCNSRGAVVQLDPFLPFNVTNSCYVEPESEMVDHISQDSSKSRTVKVEISWEPPKLEPTCTSSANCKAWPQSTCIAPKDGWSRCHCDANFRWNGSTFNCTQVEGVINKPAAEPSRESRQGRQLLMWIILPTVILGIILLASVVSFTIWRRKMTRKQENRKADKKNRTLHTLDSQRHIKDLIDSGDLTREDDQKGVDVPFFNLESILEATDDFSDLNKLGQGGYGPVYKGKFPGGEEIAVKRLSALSGQGLQEFKNEVVLIAKLQHRNLVRLRGFCIKGDEKILLYEYMANRSLDSFIFDQTRSVLLNWKTRFNIIMGIARGLLYLHQDSRLRIIHRDLKTSNILLDEEMNAKISDFGLARIFGGKQTEANTSKVVGTYGYMSPEYALDGFFSIKSDVFSFGVVLLEIISGKKNTGFYQSDRPLNLLGFAWRLWTGEKVLELMDEALHESCKEDQFIKCVNVGLLCVQDDPSDRPTMSNVITMLDSESASLPTPKEPAFVIRRGFSSTASSSVPETNTEITIALQEDRLV